MYNLKPGLKFLNSKEIKEIRKKLEETFSLTEHLDYAYLINANNRVNIVTKEIDNLNLDLLMINSIGVYFCELKDHEIRLSIEGSQIVGPLAKKNVLELDEEKARDWIRGQDVDYPGSTKGFVIIKHKNDYMGCAKHKDGKLLNHVPKERRVRSKD